MDKNKALNNLKDLKTIFDSLHIKYWLTDGTLLGLHREGDFMDHDLDTDIGLMIDDYSPILIKKIALFGFTVHRAYGRHDNGLEIALKRGGVKTDLFFFYTEGDTLVHSAWDYKTDEGWHQIKYRYPKSIILPVGNAMFKGIKFNVPARVANFLATKYGDFNQVVKEWDWRYGPENAEKTDCILPDSYVTGDKVMAAYEWNMLSALTILIVTFQRDNCLGVLIESIRKRYPFIKLMIVNNGKEPLRDNFKDKHTKWIDLPFDSGLSASRNAGVNKITTPFFLLCDDDFVFTDETDLTRLMEIHLRTGVDIMGGMIEEKGELLDYYGNLNIDFASKTLIYQKQVEQFPDHSRCEMILNFFVARTADIRKYPWDNELKVAEHTAFFYACKGLLKVGYTHQVKCVHLPVRDDNYKPFRMRGKHFFTLWMKRKGLHQVINFKGETIIYK